MTSKRAAYNDANDDNEKRPNNKRQRFGDDTTAVAPPSLDIVNDDCLLVIMKYLKVDDLNSIAICGKRYRKVRGHESLDQHRVATLILSERSSFNALVSAIIKNKWNQSLLRGNQTHLEIVGIDRLKGEPDVLSRRIAKSKLTAITSLGLKNSRIAEMNRRTIPEDVVWPFSFLFSNLREVDLSSLANISSSGSLLSFFGQHCPNMARITWTEYQTGFDLNGAHFNGVKNLTELYIDGSCFSASDELELQMLGDRILRGVFMLRLCYRLERLSIKDATYKQIDYPSPPRMVPQDIIIEMVRQHPTLRWLRSDLTEENIDMLKQERPEITFVSD